MTPPLGRTLSGIEAGALLRNEVAERVAALAAMGKRVGLATLLVGNNPASEVYVRIKHRNALEAGIHSYDHRLPATAAQHEVEAFVDELNLDPDVDAFLVQLPLPGHLDPAPVSERIEPRKDADGLHPHNLGRLVLGLPAPRPATPTGILRLLDYHDVSTRGARVVIVGRSSLVGRPLSIMLSARGRDATVSVAHTLTDDLAAVTREADILVVAAGHPRLIRAEHVKPGAVVVDVGTTRLDSGLVGDVAFDEVIAVAAGVTPVPGGVGPMTIAGLLWNTVMLAEQAHS
ncbi:MAG: bifunctional methylenetetrahydrofolate dehydrogenase/methenyltetrahydrofolate cyclohydrolase [Actinobacteria bacterium RBG_16_67_15]|nr:MAG: bifunctional methylenetetrahydrofolate dehydrogenase/methenyltetrahydrofolate cyclohydrolase [Actinobacteria bacterium RBG_16_67_15]